MSEQIVVTTSSDEYINVFVHDEQGRFVSLDGLHLKIRMMVRDEEYIVEWIDGEENDLCKKESIVCEYSIDANGDKVVYQEELGAVQDYLECIQVEIPKYTFNQSGMLKIAICNIIEDDNFDDGNKEEWSLLKSTNIKYKED
jgi:hypothetical protein